MTWAILTPIVVAFARENLGPWIADLLNKWLPKTGDRLPMAAPSDLKSVIRGAIQAAVDKLNRPVVSALSKVVLNALNGRIMDAIWDKLFAAKLVAATAASFPQLAEAETQFTHEDAAELILGELGSA